ncbi:SCO family protein [Parasedimentitalea maritima]|uniref:SCO family protein n=1 Tax=Parasedimentitalea maritima TaxID=2578117 RepID=A0ABY2USN9_9RHOB|nr:SCO family protein [Zongyanglinia marina]TLP61394.1 SCO family protein [Zongyanglinia marina]
MKQRIVTTLGAILLASGGFSGQNSTPTTPDGSIAALFPMGEEFEFTPPIPGSYRLSNIKPAPDGAVLTPTGTKRDLSDLLDGKVSLVSFVYLMCGDVNGCPLAVSTLFDIYDSSQSAPDLADNVQLVTISFDPDRDTVEAIDSFAYPITNDATADKKIGWHILTTEDQAALKPILDGFGQVVDRSDDPDKLNHLLRMFLVDRDGKIRNIYGLGLIDPRLMMTDVETLLIEDGTL